MSTSPPPPPLWSMPLALGLALAVCGGLFASYWSERVGLEELREAVEAQSLERLTAERREASLRVVALGHSLLESGTFTASRMESLAAEGGLDLGWSRVDRRGGGFLGWEGAVEHVLTAAPDVILVEQRFLVAPTESRFRKHLTHARKHLKWLLTRGPAAGWSAEARARQILERVYLDEERPADALAQATVAAGRVFGEGRPWAFGSLPDMARRRPAFPFARLVAGARERGLQVVIVETPVHADAKRPLSNTRSEELAQALASEHDVLHLPCPLPLERSDYEADLAHFTPEGRLRYSGWLIAELAKLAEAR